MMVLSHCHENNGSFYLRNFFSIRRRASESFSKKCDILGTKNEKKIANLWFSVFLKITVLKQLIFKF